MASKQARVFYWSGSFKSYEHITIRATKRSEQNNRESEERMKWAAIITAVFLMMTLSGPSIACKGDSNGGQSSDSGDSSGSGTSDTGGSGQAGGNSGASSTGTQSGISSDTSQNHQSADGQRSTADSRNGNSPVNFQFIECSNPIFKTLTPCFEQMVREREAFVSQPAD